MKRLTALALAGVLLLGTACGGGNQANDAATQAGAATTQDQTADGAEEAAAETAEAEEGTADPAASGDTEKTADEKTESTSGSRPKSDAKGGKGDAITTEDENVFTGDGTVTAFIGEPFYDGVIKDEQEAYKAVQSVYDRIGADSTTRLELSEIRPTEENVCYTFAQMAGDIRVYGNAIKLITDKDGKAIGLVSAILPNVKAAPVDEWGITAEEAEAIIEDYYKEDDVHAVDGATDKILMPMADGAEIYCYAWVVYTENFSTQYDAAYLAHYVKSDGEYLYALPISEPHNADALAGDVTAFVFDKMEEAEWTGTIRHKDGSEEEITVPLMQDTETGRYVLGDAKRKILCADFADYRFNDTLTPRTSDEGTSWNEGELLTYYNFIRVWDYYKEIGWTGPDDDGTPALLLMDLVDENGDPIDNAFYKGRERGFQVFAFNPANYGDCTDVIGHEFTHCVTGTTMTTNLYLNEYGAINEAMSDIMGNIIEMTIDDRPEGAWIIAENATKVQRSFKDPNQYQQPGYFWDQYFVPNVARGTDNNDNGGVHTNSSLLNVISYKLSEAGMDADDQCYFWMNVALVMTPRTDFAQMAQILPWCMKSAGYPQYEDAVRKALEETGYSNRELPDSAAEGKALITFKYDAPEKYQDYDPAVMLFDIDDDGHRIYTWPEGGTGQVAVCVTEGRYALTLILENAEEGDLVYYLYSEDGWESYDREGIEEKLGDLDPESVIEAGSGERKELDAPEW